jgi:hypothetical protein
MMYSPKQGFVASVRGCDGKNTSPLYRMIGVISSLPTEFIRFIGCVLTHQFLGNMLGAKMMVGRAHPARAVSNYK